MKHKRILLLVFVMLTSLNAISGQQKLNRVDKMADFPQPYYLVNYEELTKKFDRTVYDFNSIGEYWPLLWIDNRNNNFLQPTVGIYTAVGDIRQGPATNDGTFHEALTSMGAVLGATLVGINKSNQDGLNFVGMLKNYFNRDTGWNIMQNNTNPEAGSRGGGYGRDWWYDVFPNLLFYAIYDKYPQEQDFREMAKSIADKFLAADTLLKGNYNYSYFDYAKMEAVTNWICPQPDVAAGHSWVLYSAYKKFGDEKYLRGSISSLNALSANKTNPSYEVLMPFGAYMAARLNAEQGEKFDVKKMLNWTFNGDAICRKGWGVLVGRWNGYDISGIMGSTVDRGGYGFVMNTYDMAWPLVPLVRYDQSYASVIGKWMLNAANAVKMAYPEYAAPEHQTRPDLAYLTKGVIAYEGITKVSDSAGAENKLAPIAQGDGPKWIEGNPLATEFGVYGSAHVGIFGSIIRPTNEPGILQLNLLATDFFRDPAYPTYLYYNPHRVSKRVTIPLDQNRKVDIYDSVTGKFLKRGAITSVSVKVPASGAVVIVQVPNGGTVTRKGNQMLVDGIVIDYKAR